METFFMKLIICICAIIGSETPQNLCIMGVTATRNSTMSQAPILVRKPSKMQSPPRSASSPEIGTAIEASGTPWAAA